MTGGSPGAGPWFDQPDAEYAAERERRRASGAPEIVLSLADQLRTEGLAVLDPPFEAALLDGAARATRNLVGVWSRVQDLADTDPSIAGLACHPWIIETLSQAYGRRAFPFQTLNFPRGSEQAPHADTLHFSSHPFGFMCGVWIALEDVGPEQGPLVYYPGSHLLPAVSAEDLDGRGGAPGYPQLVKARLEAGGFQPRSLTIGRGQAVVWAANLVHGGGPIKDPQATRLSQVTHYYFEDCVYTTPIYSRPSIGRVYVRRPYNLAARRLVTSRYDGRPVPSALRASAGAWLRRLRRKPKFFR
jgi:hypothetical protein